MLPFGAKATEVAKPDALQVETAKQAGREKLLDTTIQGKSDLEDQRAQDKLKYEEARQEHRKELLEDASKYKIDLEKLKSSLKPTSPGGKIISKDAFVDRHYNSTYNAIVKDEGQPAASARKAIAILERAYDSMKPAATNAPAPKVTPQASTNSPAATAPAPAAAAQGTNDISFDDFQNWKKNR